VFGLGAYLWILCRILGDALAAAGKAAWEARATGAGVVGAMVALLFAAIFTNALIYPPVLIYLWAMAGTVAALREEAP